MIEIALYRIVMSLLILPFPLFGGIIAILTEFIDLDLLKIIEPESIDKYQKFDKTLDLFYLGLEAFTVTLWKNILARNTVLILFLIRLIGTILFNSTEIEYLLVLFPNIFEWIYLYYLIYLKLFKKDPFTTKKSIFIIIVILLLPKVFHEYYLHVFLPDNRHPELIQDFLLRFNLHF